MMFFIGFLSGFLAAVCLCLLTPGFGEEDTEAGATVVTLRDNRGTNCKHWNCPVKYDAWGSPYVFRHQAFGSKTYDHGEISLHKDGTTSDTWLRGTEWMHVSGPDVTFGERPARPFAKAVVE